MLRHLQRSRAAHGPGDLPIALQPPASQGADKALAQTNKWNRFCCLSAFYNIVTKAENIFVAGAYPIIFHGLMSWGGALFRGGGHG